MRLVPSSPMVAWDRRVSQNVCRDPHVLTMHPSVDDETSGGDMTRLGNSATEAAMLRPLHRQAGGRNEEPAPYFAWQPIASAGRFTVPIQCVS